MSEVIPLEEARLFLAAKKGFRNWTSRFKEAFGMDTRVSMLSISTLSYLAQGHDRGAFYLYDLIMNLRNLGSGLEFNELNPKDKLAVIDQYLFLLDRIRFDCMKRLGWIDSYPGEDFPLVELIIDFHRLAPGFQAKVPALSKSHPEIEAFERMNTLDREAFIRKMIPKALKEIRNYSTTL